MRVLVTGGAGYIGAHVVRLLADRGDTPVIVDDLVTGVRERVADHPILELDLAAPGSADRLSAYVREQGVDSVIHFAARKQVGESVDRPLWYYEQNQGGLTTVLHAMVDNGLKNLVFSSSAAVYGEVTGTVVEDQPLLPLSPYGETKLLGEWLTAATARAEGLRTVALRYFNVAGSGWPELADTSVLNLIPIVLDRLSRGKAPEIYGDDYPTSDGSCIRDYVHVLDLAEAHLVVLDALDRQPEPFRVYNVGTGTGATVREVVEGIRRRVGDAPEAVVRPRRPGDPATIVADPSRIADQLGWRARLSLDDILDSAWAAR